MLFSSEARVNVRTNVRFLDASMTSCQSSPKPTNDNLSQTLCLTSAHACYGKCSTIFSAQRLVKGH